MAKPSVINVRAGSQRTGIDRFRVESFQPVSRVARAYAYKRGFPGVTTAVFFNDEFVHPDTPVGRFGDDSFIEIRLYRE